MTDPRLLTRAEQHDFGVSLRQRMSRSSQADLSGPPDRDPIAVLAGQNRDRIGDLLSVRRERMSESPFAFYRGAAAVMAADLGAGEHTGHQVTLCGDAHLANFGAFASHERTLVFDVNDFDETWPGPWEWDLKRLLTSVTLHARACGLAADVVREVSAEVARSYREAMHRFSDLSARERYFTLLRADDVLDWTHDLVGHSELTKKDAKRLTRGIAKATANTSERAWTKLGVERGVDGRARIADEPPLTRRLEGLGEVSQRTATDLAHGYRGSVSVDVAELLGSYRFEDAVLRVVGVGSVGTRCFVTLWTEPDGEPLFLQIKEAGASVLAPFVTGGWVEDGAERVVRGQRIMQASGDPFLGALAGPDGRSYYVRQFRDMKGSVDLARLTDRAAVRAYGALCASALARAHAQAGTPGVIAGYLGRVTGQVTEVDRAFASFAEDYADRTEADHARLLAATPVQWAGSSAS